MNLERLAFAVCFTLLLALAWLVDATCIHPAPHESSKTPAPTEAER